MIKWSSIRRGNLELEMGPKELQLANAPIQGMENGIGSRRPLNPCSLSITDHSSRNTRLRKVFNQ